MTRRRRWPWLRTAGARKPSFPSPAAAVIAFERAVSRLSVRRRPTHGPSRGLALLSSSSSPSPLDHRDGHYDMIITGGGAVGSALARMMLDDTTAASASAPDSGGTQAIISIPCRRRHRIRACGLSTTPSFGRGGPTGGNNGVGKMTRQRPRLYVDSVVDAIVCGVVSRSTTNF